MNEKMIAFGKTLIFHYADGGSLQEALVLLRANIAPNRKNLTFPADCISLYSTFDHTLW